MRGSALIRSMRHRMVVLLCALSLIGGTLPIGPEGRAPFASVPRTITSFLRRAVHALTDDGPPRPKKADPRVAEAAPLDGYVDPSAGADFKPVVVGARDPNAPKGFVPDRSVEVPASRTLTQKIFANPDGSKTAKVFAAPVHFRDPKTGEMREIDTSLREAAGGLEATGLAHPVRVQGGTAPSVRVGEPGRSVGLGWNGQPGAAAATTDGKRASTGTIRNVAPGVDLTVRVLTQGVNTIIDVADREALVALGDIELPLELDGMTPKAQPDGTILFTDPAGAGFALHEGRVWDSNVDTRLGESPSAPVTFSVVPTADGPRLRVSPDAAYLADPSRQFPIHIDPHLEYFDLDTGVDDATVMSVDPYGHYNGATQIYSNYTEMYDNRVGYYDETTGWNEAFHWFDLTGLTNTTIDSAKWYGFWDWSTQDVPTDYFLYPNMPSWGGSTITWDNKPDRRPGESIVGSAMYGQRTDRDVTQWVRNWASGAWQNYGVVIDSGNTGAEAWKRIAAAEEGIDVAPFLEVNFTDYHAIYEHDVKTDPNGPAGTVWTGPTPTSSAQFPLTIVNDTDADEWTVGQYEVGYHVKDRAGNSLYWDNARKPIPHNVAPNQHFDITLPIAPLPAGAYRIEIEMVHVGVAWFSQRGVLPVSFDVLVKDPAVPLSPEDKGFAVDGVDRSKLDVHLIANTQSGVGQYRYELSSTASFGQITATSLWINAPGSAGYIPGAVGWRVTAGVLKDGATYFWRVAGRDATAQSSYSPIRSFTVDARQLGHRPNNPVHELDVNGPAAAKVDLASGNLVADIPLITLPTASQPVSISATYNSHGANLEAYIDDRLPAGAQVPAGAGPTFTNGRKASGSSSIYVPTAGGVHQQYFYASAEKTKVPMGAWLETSVWLDPSVREVMLQFYTEEGGFEHRAIWGEDLIAWGAGTGHFRAGALPAKGKWVRLVVNAADVGLGGKTWSGMAFTLYDGAGWFDAAGIVKPGLGRGWSLGNQLQLADLSVSSLRMVDQTGNAVASTGDLNTVEGVEVTNTTGGTTQFPKTSAAGQPLTFGTPPGSGDLLARAATGTWQLNTGDGLLYQLDATGALSTVTVDDSGPGKPAASYTYLADTTPPQLRSITDPEGRKLDFTWSPPTAGPKYGRLTSISGWDANPDGGLRTISLLYSDDTGQLTGLMPPGFNITQFNYTDGDLAGLSWGGLLSLISMPLSIDPTSGLVLSGSYDFTYGAMGVGGAPDTPGDRVTKVVAPPDSNNQRPTTAFDYQATSTKVKEPRCFVSASACQFLYSTQSNFDSRRRETMDIDASGAARRYGYDVNNRRISVVDAAGRVQETTLNGDGKPLATRGNQAAWTGLTGSGLYAEYFSTPDLSGEPTMARVDKNVDFTWGGGAPAGTGVPADGFSVRWTGNLAVPAPGGVYTLTTSADDGTRVLVDGNVVIDNWISQNETAVSGSLSLTPGPHRLTVEYSELGGAAAAHLRWSGPGVGTGPIPQLSLSPLRFASSRVVYDQDATTQPMTGLRAQFWDNKDLAGTPKAQQTYAFANNVVDATWNDGSPAPGIAGDNWSARFTGMLNVSTAGSYTFTAGSDDGARVFIDGQLAVDNWRYGAYQELTGSARTLTRGDHTIQIDFTERDQWARFRLAWSLNGAATTTVPVGATRPAYGLVTTSVDEDGDRTMYRYDGGGGAFPLVDPLRGVVTDQTEWGTVNGVEVPLTLHRSYDAFGRVVSSISPQGMRQPEGVARDPYTTRYWYVAKDQALPAGFPAPAPPAVHPRMVHVVQPSGQSTRTEQDESGAVTTETTWGPGLPAAGVATTYAYDAAGNQTRVTGPAVTNVVTGATTQTRMEMTYEPTGAVRTTKTTDVPSGQSRSLTIVHDRLGREVKLKDVFGFEINRTFDLDGNMTDVIDQRNSHQRTTYDQRSLPTQVQVINYTDPATGVSIPATTLSATGYAVDGQPAWTEDALARRTTIDYDPAGRPWKSTLTNYKDHPGARTPRAIVLNQTTYSLSGRPTTEITGGGLRTAQHTYDKAGRRLTTRIDPSGVNRTATVEYDANDNPVRLRVSKGDPGWAGTAVDETTSVYDPADRLTDRSVRYGNQAADLLTTHWDRDVFGNPTLIRDPEGRQTRIDYDVLGRQVRVTEPVTTVEASGTAPISTSPVTTWGYDGFSNQTHEKDAAGNTTITDYDAGNRRWQVRHPAYTPPGGTTLNPLEVWQYDKAGNVASYTSRRNKQTVFAFDSLNRNTKTTDPLVAGNAAPGIVVATYDWVGNRTAEVDQLGARTEKAYDSLNRIRMDTQVVRNGTATPDRFTTTYAHNDAGDRYYTQDPSGHITNAFFDGAGQQHQFNNADGKATRFVYDHAGRTRGTIDPLGRATEERYDRAGRLVRSTNRKLSTTTDPLAGPIVSATAWAYDKAGNRTREWTPNDIAAGRDPDTSPTSLPTNEWAYNAAGDLTSVVTRPDLTQSISTTYGYDAGGNLTRLTNGEGRATSLTYQPWDLVEKVIEPSTAAQPNLTDRTWTRTYDAGGLPVGESQPGGVSITRSYDELGRILQETGSGGGAPTGSKAWTWDLAGQQKTASHPTAPLNFNWDDRGLLTSSTGGAGSSSFEYFPDGQLKKRTDAAGSSSFTWTNGDQLLTMTDPLTATTQTRQYDNAGQLSKVSLPSGARRDLTWDDLGRLKTDTLTNSTGQISAGHGYGYDNNGNMTGQDLTLPGNPSAGSHGYEYDRAGRLTKWTAPNGTPTAYGWDRAGNRTSAGGVSSTYDERNRLLSGPEGTNTWTPRGTMASTATAGGPTSYTFDGLGRLTQAATPGGTVGYSLDALDRIAARNGQPFTYAATELDPVTDGAFTYARGPAGDVAALSGPAGARLVGSDAHNDLTHLYSPTGTVSDTAAYDPFGKIAGETGTTDAPIGFQGDYTDPTTNKVWMGARWYDPKTGGFLSRDDNPGELSTPTSLNRFTYGLGDPLGRWDPNGYGWPKPPKIFRQIGNAIVKVATTVFNTVSDWVEPIWDRAWDIVGGFIEGVRDFVSDVADTVGGWMSTAARTVGNAAASVAQGTYRQFTDTVSAAQRAAEQAAAAQRAFANNLRQAAKTLTRPAAKFVRSVDTAARQAMKHAAAEGRKAARAAADGARSAVSWTRENAGTIAKTAAVWGAGALAFGACMGATGGAGVVVCGMAAGAAAGAVNGLLNCPKGKAIAGCVVKDAAIGGVSGALGGGIAGRLGNGFLANALGGGVSSAAEQYLGTGQVNAKGVAMGAGAAAAGSMGGKGCRNSFLPSTEVLLADGSSKPISEVRVGDSVQAADPATGVSGSHRVTNVIVGTGLKDLVDVGLDSSSTTTATAGHPYYRTDDQTWVPAGDLRVGDHVVDAAGQSHTVTSLRPYQQQATVWNLTVEGLHTYYAGTEHILVHNSGHASGGECFLGGAVEGHDANGPITTPYNRQAQYGGAATNGPAGRKIRADYEGKVCTGPACGGATMRKGTPNAPVPQHEPPLVKHHFDHGGGHMGPKEARGYARSDKAFNGAMCAQCQASEGGHMSAYSKEQKRIRGL